MVQENRGMCLRNFNILDIQSKYSSNKFFFSENRLADRPMEHSMWNIHPSDVLTKWTGKMCAIPIIRIKNGRLAHLVEYDDRSTEWDSIKTVMVKYITISVMRGIRRNEEKETVRVQKPMYMPLHVSQFQSQFW